MYKRWLIYIAVLIITALLSVAYLESAPTVLLCVECMLLILSFLYGLLSLPGVVVTPVLGDETRTVGEKCELVARIKNRSILPVFYGEMEVELSYRQSDEVITLKIPFASMPGRPQEMSYSFKGDYSGSLYIAYKYVYVYDFLRLFRFKSRIKAKGMTVSFMPEFQRLVISDKSSRFMTPVTFDQGFDETDPESHVQQFYKDRVGDDPSEVFDTRGYRVGDSLSRVNWKLSARAGELMVKDYSFPIIEKTVILVDLNCHDQRDFHERVHTAMAICFSLLESDMCAALAWGDTKAGICQMRRFEKDEDLFVCMGELINADLSGPVSPLELLGGMHLTSQMEQLIYITSGTDDEELNSLDMIEQSRRVYIFNIGDEELSQTKLTDKIYLFNLPEEGLEDALGQTLLEVY